VLQGGIFGRQMEKEKKLKVPFSRVKVSKLLVFAQLLRLISQDN
jgi:hypothetical protein